jgi:hypothetical protein
MSSDNGPETPNIKGCIAARSDPEQERVRGRFLTEQFKHEALMRDGSASLACALACEVAVLTLLMPSRMAHAILYIERGQGSIDDRAVQTRCP